MIPNFCERYDDEVSRDLQNFRQLSENHCEIN